MEWYELLLVFLAMGFVVTGVCGSGYCASERPAGGDWNGKL